MVASLEVDAKRKQLPPIDQYITLRSPELRAPYHLQPLLDIGERVLQRRDRQLKFWFSVPPRHWKTFTVRHIVTKHMEVWPSESVAWCTHKQGFARKQSRAIKKILARAEIFPDPLANTQDEWQLPAGGEFSAKGVGVGIAGEGYRLIVIDDPFGKQKDAESIGFRDRVNEWIENDVLTRLTPDGVVLLIHTRWHPDDAIGRYEDDEEWSGCNIKALCERTEEDPLGRQPGEALLPDVWTREYLERLKKKNPAKFAALYQGDPQPRGGRLFHGATRYFRELPRSGGFTVAYGGDLAFTASKKADRSVCLQGHRFGQDIYFTGGIFDQVEATTFLPMMATFVRVIRGALRWYIGGGGEKGVSSFVKKRIDNFKPIPAVDDKLVRATPLAESWNDGRVFIPSEQSRYWGPWVPEFEGEINLFTGVNDPSDDFIDAGAACHDELMEGYVPDDEEGLGGVVSDRYGGDDDDDDDMDD